MLKRGAGAGESALPSDKQLTLFLMDPVDSWKLLSTDRLRLDKDKYGKIRECYRQTYDSFLPGPANSTPFLTQVSGLLKSTGLAIGPRTIARLVSRAQALGIKDFPDPRTRAVSSSSPKAGRLQTPGSSLRMSQQEHNAFAEIYRELLKTWRKGGKLGGGFFAQAAARMHDRGFDYTDKKLTSYAQYRRRIGDVNFPRIRGSQDIERMQVAAVDRIQALGVMATGLMHEVLQPLQVIQMTAEQQKTELDRDDMDRSRVAEQLERIIRHAKTIDNVVRHVRTIARAGEVRTEPVIIRSAIEAALTLFSKQLQSKGIEVNLQDVAASLPPVHADPIALERVFINLIINARDAIEETSRGSGIITISASEAGNAVHCDVRDDGTGIDPSIVDRIFDPYFTTKKVDKGTGMGLTEVLNIMIQFGGKVIVDSTPNQGTVFRLEFQKHAPRS